MEKIKKNINKIIILLVLVFVATFIYNYVGEEEKGDISEVIIGNESKEARDILETLNELDKINIDYQFFYDKGSGGSDELIFIVDGKEYILRDFSQKELSPKEFGKNNPFSEENTFYENVNKKEVN
jgi:hypothetical protein